MGQQNVSRVGLIGRSSLDASGVGDPSPALSREIQVSWRFVPIKKTVAWIRPMEYMTFTEDVKLRGAEYRHVPDTIDGLERTRVDLPVRSIFRGVLWPVNPSRPVSPTSSRLLASPFRRNFRSQVMGR